MDADWPLGSRVGVVGGGQLGRMMGEAATPLGVELVVLDPTPHAPASPVAREQIVAEFDDSDAVERLARGSDVLTYEIELADPDVLEALEERTGTPVHPAPETLRRIEDKFVQKRTLDEAGIPVSPCRAVETAEDVREACDDLGYPAMLKARRGGYDGRGTMPVRNEDEIAGAIEAMGGDLMIESFVPFVRELSVIGVKGDGEREAYVAGENEHEAEILRETIVPARTGDEVLERARSVADDVLDLMVGRGVFGIELFELDDGAVLVNEIAPRPHNSGHWTIEGAVTSQFEQHIRAVVGGPLGATGLRTPIVTANILGDVESPAPAAPNGISELLAARDARLHWYGKREVRRLRKMGHIAVYDPGVVDRDELLARARNYKRTITFT